MLILPIKNKAGRDALIVVLGPDNLERMRRGDPAEIQQCGKVLHNPMVAIAYQEPSPEWNRLVQMGDVSAMVAHLYRGFEFRPDLGDNDDGPRSVHEGN